ncbi:MAG TPA: hypothetical protein DCR40_18175 [Prolixibacteraceae bacterium]|nr:hypothetical protein [Prolixibacteraceae bacterium]
MDQASQVKVINAGFTILRCDDQPTSRIKFKGKDNHEWRTLEKFETKAARDRAFKNFMEMSFTIND